MARMRSERYLNQRVLHTADYVDLRAQSEPEAGSGGGWKPGRRGRQPGDPVPVSSRLVGRGRRNGLPVGQPYVWHGQDNWKLRRQLDAQWAADQAR